MADAGDNISTTLGSTVQLDGTGSSVCSRYADQAIYTWTLLSAPTTSAVDESSLSDNETPTATQPMFTPDEVGAYSFQLVVSDPTAQSAPDVVVVTVTSGDAAPIADCGGPYEGQVDEAVQLDGTGSSDPEGAALEYTWALSGVPDCSALDSSDIYNGASSTPTVVPDCDGIFTVSLVVSDGANYSEPAECYIDVASENRAPVADAGENTDYGACADNPLTLDGYGSYDPDGDPITYRWSVVSVPTDSAAGDDNFDDPTSPEPRFTWDVEGTYIFQLEVDDGSLPSAPDTVTITIAGEGDNHAPLANAGMDQTVEKTADCTSASYVWTCEDCEEATVDLDGTGSRDPDGDTLSYYWSESTETMSFTNRFGVMTTGVIPAQPAEYGTDSTTEFTVTLDVADCQETDSDTLTITYTCTGEAAR